MISFLHDEVRINLPRWFIESIVLQAPTPLVPQRSGRFRVAVVNANRSCNKVEGLFNRDCFRMSHGDVAVAGVGRGFDCSRPRQLYINYCLSQFSCNNIESIYSFDSSRSGTMKEYGSYCEFAFPWSIDTSIQC